MIVDVTGTILTPGNGGVDCLGNGTHEEIECSCDECDYLLCCQADHDSKACQTCTDRDCPHSQAQK